MDRQDLKHFRKDGMEGTMVSQGSCCKDFRRQLEGYGLTTANILYRRPDHPWLLQSYVWQDYDLFPKFPNAQQVPQFLAGDTGGTVAFGDGGARAPGQARRNPHRRRRVSLALTGCCSQRHGAVGSECMQRSLS